MLSGQVTRDDVFELLAVARFGVCAAAADSAAADSAASDSASADGVGGTVVFWNRRAEQIAGMPASEVTGRPLSEVLADAQIAPIRLAGQLITEDLDRSGPSAAGADADLGGELSVYLFDDSPAAGVDSQPSALLLGTVPQPPSASRPPGFPPGQTGALAEADRTAAPGILSSRETEIVRLIAAGVPTDQIAAQLRISVHTVRNHVRNLRRKLGAKTKLDAVVMAMREGLLAADRNPS